MSIHHSKISLGRYSKRLSEYKLLKIIDRCFMAVNKNMNSSAVRVIPYRTHPRGGFYSTSNNLLMIIYNTSRAKSRNYAYIGSYRL